MQSGQLKLTGDVLAQIYLGKIIKWNDPALAALNPGTSLPDLPIAVVHRSDGSGSTLAWTRYLSAANPEWKSGPGSDTLIEWPAGTGAEGTSGMLSAVQGSKGSIGYVEYGQAARLGLAVAQLSNGSGAFVTPSPEVFARTAAEADWDPARGFYLQLTDVEAADAYPWLPRRLSSCTKANARPHARGARCSSCPMRWSAAGLTRRRWATCPCLPPLSRR